MSSQKPTLAQQEQYLQSVRTEVQTKMMQELMSQMTNKCFNKCIEKSGQSMSTKERSCLANCMDRYMETMTVFYFHRPLLHIM